MVLGSDWFLVMIFFAASIGEVLRAVLRSYRVVRGLRLIIPAGMMLRFILRRAFIVL